MKQDMESRRVSEAYRQAATETSPAALDEKIMANARREARTRYGLARTWVRPLAWAATIALSFAFVLEMTYFDDEPPIEEMVPATALDEVAESVPEPSSGPALEQDAAPAERAEPVKRSRAPVAAAPEFKVEDASGLREAEDRAATAADEVSTAKAASFAMPAAPGHCDAVARENAETWYACIETLRDEGLEDAADAELAALRAAFPDFEVPVPE